MSINNIDLPRKKKSRINPLDNRVGKPGVTGVAFEHPLEGVGKDYRLCRGGIVPHQICFFVQFIGLRNNAP